MSRSRQLLLEGLAEQAIPCSDTQIELLMHYHDLLLKWGRVYNLTAILESEKIISLHLLDSLSILPYLQGQRVLDVGSGAGLPGIPLSILAPELNFSLLDSNAKKTRFIRQATLQLSLSSVQVVQLRVEDFLSEQTFDTIVMRAFAPLSVLLKRCLHLLRPGKQLLVMMGQFPEEEIEQLAGIDYTIIPLKVPGVCAKRHLLRISAA